MKKCRQVSILCLLLPSCLSLSLLGGGEGRGSCPAPPYRAATVNWPNGCPLDVPCCNEFGFCKTEADWLSGQFRDCNGLSNGLSLPDDVLRLEAIYTAIKNGLANGPIFNETTAADLDTATGGDAPAVIIDVDDTATALSKTVVAGEGGGGGDGGEDGEGGFRGAGGDGGSGGNGGANDGTAGNGGLGGNGGAGGAGGNGGDGGNAGFFVPSQYNTGIGDARGSFQLIRQPSLMTIIGGKAGSGGAGGQGGDGIGKEKGAKGGNGGSGGLGQIGGYGGTGGNGGKGGLNAAGGNGGNGGNGGYGISKVFLETVSVENNSVLDPVGQGGQGGDGGYGGDGGAGLGDGGDLLLGGKGGQGGSGSDPRGPKGGQGGSGGLGGSGGGKGGTGGGPGGSGVSSGVSGGSSGVLGGSSGVSGGSSGVSGGGTSGWPVQYPAGVTAEECPNYPYCTYDV